MISNKIISKIHDVLVARLMLGNTPAFTVYPHYHGIVIPSEDHEKFIKQFNSTVKSRKKHITDFSSGFHGFIQEFNGVEFVFEQQDEIGPDEPILVSISPTSVIDILTDMAFTDIHTVKEYMKEALDAKEVQIKVTY